MGVALGSHWCGFGVPIGWLSVGFEVALGWLWTPEYMPSICLLDGFAVALGGLSVQVSKLDVGCWMFDVRCSMFRTANRPGSQRPRGPEGARKSNTRVHSDPLRTGTVRGRAPVRALT